MRVERHIVKPNLQQLITIRTVPAAIYEYITTY